MAIFNSYVSLPEGKRSESTIKYHLFIHLYPFHPGLDLFIQEFAGSLPHRISVGKASWHHGKRFLGK
jgi:hypothetical protein